MRSSTLWLLTVLAVAALTPGVASAQLPPPPPVYTISDVIPTNSPPGGPMTEVTQTIDAAGNGEIIISAKCSGTGYGANVQGCDVITNKGTPIKSFTLGPNGTSGTCTGTVKFTPALAAGTQVSITFVFGVNGPNQSFTTTFKVK